MWGMRELPRSCLSRSIGTFCRSRRRSRESLSEDRRPTALEPGDSAPDFTLPDQHGTAVKLSELKGQTVVLYFYSTADT